MSSLQHSAAVAALLIGHRLKADVNLVLIDEGGQLVMADVTIKFRVLGGHGLYAQYRCREGFLLLAVGAIPQ